MYAITFRNKIVAVYFGTLAFARLAVTLASAFLQPVTFIELPPVPVDAFNLCPVVVHLRFKLAPNSLSTTFGALAVSPVASAELQGLLITGGT